MGVHGGFSLGRIRAGLGEWFREGRIQWSAARSGAGHGRGGGDERTHSTPDVLGTGHLSQLLTSISPTESIGGCGGRRSLETVERESEGGRTGFYMAHVKSNDLAPKSLLDHSHPRKPSIVSKQSG